MLCRIDDGTIVDQASAPHPDGTECDPRHWWAALRDAGRGLLERAAAIGIAAQQHGMVALDAAGRPIRPALLWNDTRSAPQAAALIDEFGGPRAWAERTGSVPVASYTVTKLRWMAEHEPDNAARTAAILLPHDWLTWRLRADVRRPADDEAGDPSPRDPAAGDVDPAEFVTDRGDASGTGYWSPATGTYLPDIARAALGHDVALPRVAGPREVVGETATGALLAPGTGDNMGAALGLGLGPGDVAVSIGTSGTAFAVAERPAADAAGLVSGFADATGRFLPLVCTLNAARVLSTTASLLGVDLAGLSELALAAAPGAGGLVLLPYLDGERTPNRPNATGVLRGLTTASATRENLARAAVEGVLAGLADAVDHLTGQGISPRRVLLIGGGARSEAVRRIAPDIFGVPVTVPEPAEYVALGAARQAAWALAGTPEPPAWPGPPATEYVPDRSSGEAGRRVRAQYADLRDDTATWGTWRGAGAPPAAAGGAGGRRGRHGR